MGEPCFKGVLEMLDILVSCLNSGYGEFLREDIELAINGDEECLCQLFDAFEEIEEITCE